jgi:hypothetical protein
VLDQTIAAQQMIAAKLFFVLALYGASAVSLAASALSFYLGALEMLAMN